MGRKVSLPEQAETAIAEKANIRAADQLGIMVERGQTPETVIFIADDGTGKITAVQTMRLQKTPQQPEDGTIMVIRDHFPEIGVKEITEEGGNIYYTPMEIIDLFVFNEAKNQFDLK